MIRFCDNLHRVTYKIKGNESTIFHYNEIRDWNSFPIRSRVRVVVFNATFNNVSVISWWRRKPEYPEKTTDLSHVPIRSNPPLSYKYLSKKGGMSFKISVKNRK